MSKLAEMIVAALTEGSLLALLAVAFSVVFATTRLVNLATGAISLAAAYGLLWVTSADWLDGPAWLGVVVALLIGVVSSVLVYYAAIVPFGRFDPSSNIGWILTTFAAGLLLIEIALIWFTNQTLPVSPVVSSVFGWTGFQLVDTPVEANDLLLVGSALVLIGSLIWAERHSLSGRLFQAVSQDRDAAALQGINPRTVIVRSFVIAGVCAAVAAIGLAPAVGVGQTKFQLLGFKSLTAALIGGLGSVKGAALGGFSLGLFVAILRVTENTRLEDPLLFFGLLAVLAIRPQGILGRVAEEKA
jgi:branched-chain amino acid transport system permease protein